MLKYKNKLLRLRQAFLGLLLLGCAVQPASANLFEFQYTSTVFDSNISGVTVNDGATITVALDNGGASINGQTWSANDLQSVTFDFNNGTLVSTFSNPFDSGLASSVGDFTTDGVGTLTSVMSDWSDFSVTADFSTNGTGNGGNFSWILAGGSVTVYFEDSFTKAIELNNPDDLLMANNWSQVTAVPVPAAVWLFGSALLGLFRIRRKKNIFVREY